MPKEVYESIVHKNKAQTTLQNPPSTAAYTTNPHLLLLLRIRNNQIGDHYYNNDRKSEKTLSRTKPNPHDMTQRQNHKKQKKKKKKNQNRIGKQNLQRKKPAEAEKPGELSVRRRRRLFLGPGGIFLSSRFFFCCCCCSTFLYELRSHATIVIQKPSKKREREREREREIHRSLAARLTTPSLQPSLLPNLKHMQILLPNRNRNLIPSLLPNLSHIVVPLPEAFTNLKPCLSHLTSLFRALTNCRASGSETQL